MHLFYTYEKQSIISMEHLIVSGIRPLTSPDIRFVAVTVDVFALQGIFKW